MHRSSRSWLFIIIIVLLLSFFGCAAPSASSGESTLPDSTVFSAESLSAYSLVSDETISPLDDDAIVYITKTGECYHRDDCGYLHSSKIPITKSRAIALGYRPCSRCKP